MPKRYNITKFDILSEGIHKISNKPQDDLDPDDELLKAEAIIISSFSSGHSWRTYNCVMNNGPKINSMEVKEEYLESEKENWKRISEMDVREFVNMCIPNSIFAQWLFFNTEKEKHDIYKKAWEEIHKEFNN